MTRRVSVLRVSLLLLTLLSSTIMAKSASVLLREGLYAEEVEGDLNAAIKVYQQVIEDDSAQDNLVAQALYRQGMCYMKLKKEHDAKAAFGKLLAEHKDQTQLIAKVRPLLDELGNADPASLMPPETLMYLEIGSPGRQVETILSMLKDTPFENPLAMVGGDQDSGEQTGEKNPADFIGALMNPSMMAEFKKIRGLGIGVTGFPNDGPPPAIIVLYPGKSDILRGLLQAGLGMFGRALEPIQGMKVVSFPDGGGAAYDDTIVILASPAPGAMDQLKWSVKQYQGLVRQPSLASSNKSFAKISKRARQDNALTLWLNVNESYQKLLTTLPPEEVPQELQMANGLVDFENVEDIIASLSLTKTGLALEANANLKEGHSCVAYDMFRTPDLSAAALKAIPSNAIAMLSIGLGQPGTPQADALHQQIMNATGLDIGNDLFSNIEQITLFVTPMSGSSEAREGEIPPQAKSLGLAITSVDPQKTRDLLTTVLRTMNLIAEESDVVGGKYDITLANYEKVFGYMDQASKTTVLSFNPDLITSSLAAMKQRASGAGSGMLKNALNTQANAGSKLIMISVAGLAKFAAANTNLPEGEQLDQMHSAMEQLIQASEKTTIRLQTNEEENSLGLRLSITDLPSISQIIGPIMQIQQTIERFENQPHAGQGPPARISRAQTAPVIDGKADVCWSPAESYNLERSYYGNPSSDSDLSASFKALFDKQNLYVLVDVTDDAFQNDSDDQWLDDGVEIFIDADHSRSWEYDDNDYQYFFSWDTVAPAMGEAHHNKTGGVEYAFAKTDDGYRLEVCFPWATLGAQPSPEDAIGLDVQVNDDDDGGERDSKIAWNARQDDAWTNPSAFGTGLLLGKDDR